MALTLAVALTLVVVWPLALRNAANLPVLADPATDISSTPAASPYLRGIAALHQGN